MLENKDKGIAIYKQLKIPVFLLSGTALFMFSESFLLNDCRLLPYLVSGVICFYGAEGTILIIAEGKVKDKPQKLANQLITLLLGIVILFIAAGAPKNLTVTVSVIWGVWAILREAEEITEKVLPNTDCKITSLINVTESIAIIILSISLILNPTQHHIHSHVLLLGAELILEVLWPPLILLERKKLNKDKGSK